MLLTRGRTAIDRLEHRERCGGFTEVERLLAILTSTYALLDPPIPAEGPDQARWRIRLNVVSEQLHAPVTDLPVFNATVNSHALSV